MSLRGGTTKQSPHLHKREEIINVINFFFKVLMSSRWSVVFVPRNDAGFIGILLYQPGQLLIPLSNRTQIPHRPAVYQTLISPGFQKQFNTL